MPAIKAVFFDLDDTLILAKGGLESALRHTFGVAVSQGVPEADYPRFRSGFWGATRGLWAAMHAGTVPGDEVRRRRIESGLAAIGVQDDKLPLRMLKAWDDFSVNAPTIQEGVLELLRELRGKVFLGLITDGFRTVQRGKLARLQLEPYFDAVFISEEVGTCKPFREIFLTALEVARTKAEEAVMVGDNPNADIRGALGVGMHAIHLRPDEKGCTTPERACAASNMAQVRAILLGAESCLKLASAI